MPATEKDLFANLDIKKLPRHIAIIMDGNGRWAKKRGLPRIAGHRAGMESVRTVVEVCVELEIEVLTLYAFSTENWKRPEKEISALMSLLREYLRKEVSKLNEKGVRLQTIGRIHQLPQAVQEELLRAIEKTSNNKRLILNLALNYSGKIDIIDGICKLVTDIEKGICQKDDINEDLFNRYLYTYPLPDPELLIRTSMEMRISNFLLWQIAYTEIWITPVYWPEFRKMQLLEALLDFQKRERRFGGVKE